MRTPADEEFFERELATFLPDKIFDAHCHLDLPAFDDNRAAAPELRRVCVVCV